jgi:CheY-like chemotaxis protein
MEQSPKPPMEQKPTILCIDDEEPGRTLRKLLLESAGYDVLTAASGREGLQIFQSNSVNAVIVDYWMADMNGLAVAKELRRLNRKTPIIVLSAYVPILDEAIGLADLWIRKGEVDPEYLLAKLKELLEKRRQN